jgi:enediyne biosynthesis protein E4
MFLRPWVRVLQSATRGAASVMSQSDLRLHFGLGKAFRVDLIEVNWPTTQKIERFMQGKANQILTIREGGGIVAPASSAAAPVK